jgi:hypothetical protein
VDQTAASFCECVEALGGASKPWPPSEEGAGIKPEAEQAIAGTIAAHKPFWKCFA